MKKYAIPTMLWRSVILIVLLGLTVFAIHPGHAAASRSLEAPQNQALSQPNAPAQATAQQPEATQSTAIPVTGAASTSRLGPLIFLMAVAIFAILLLALFTRNRTTEASPSLAPGPILSSITSPPSPAAAPAMAPEIPASAASARPDPMRYEYKKTTDTIPPYEAPPIYDRSYTITVDIDRPSMGANGVLFAMGSAQDGYGMYLLEGRLYYQQSEDGAPHQLISIIPAPLGSSSIQFRFLHTGPNQGTGSLYINGRLVNSAFFGKTLDKPPAEGMDVGYDAGSPLSREYLPPYPFAGTLHRVVFEIDVA